MISSKKNTCTIIKNRFYHTTSVTRSPEWVLSRTMGFLFFEPATRVVIMVVALITVAAGTSVYEHLVAESLINAYQQIAADPNFVNSLNTTYPTLTPFNETSAELLKAKSLSGLSSEQ